MPCTRVTLITLEIMHAGHTYYSEVVMQMGHAYYSSAMAKLVIPLSCPSPLSFIAGSPAQLDIV